MPQKNCPAPGPLLPFPAACFWADFRRRVKRFSILCECAGREFWAHSNNSGSMLGLLRPGNRAFLSPALKPGRKLPYTLELLALGSDEGSAHLVGVNTLVPNRLLRAAFEAGLLPWASGYREFSAEARCGDSRFDALLRGSGLPDLWVECKNVTLLEDETAAFPDAVSARALKHMERMRVLLRSGQRAAFFYCVQRGGARCFAPAAYIDPTYAACFRKSVAEGLEIYPYQALLGPAGIDLGPALPLAPCF